jgi:hypothetical protein
MSVEKKDRKDLSNSGKNTHQSSFSSYNHISLPSKPSRQEDSGSNCHDDTRSLERNALAPSLERVTLLCCELVRHPIANKRSITYQYILFRAEEAISPHNKTLHSRLDARRKRCTRERARNPYLQFRNCSNLSNRNEKPLSEKRWEGDVQWHPL